MSKRFAEFLAEERRLTVLLLLLNSPAYSGSNYMLHAALPRFGHNVGMDQLRGDLAWLAEQLLIEVEVVQEVTLARLTTRGVDVADGRVIHPGVKRPLPE